MNCTCQFEEGHSQACDEYEKWHEEIYKIFLEEPEESKEI